MSRRLVGPAPVPSAGRSVSAATGGIRTAFRAGPIAETTVTSRADGEPDDRGARLERQRPGGQAWCRTRCSSASEPDGGDHAEADPDRG